jgi:hypothetical protein
MWGRFAGVHVQLRGETGHWALLCPALLSILPWPSAPPTLS